MNPPRLARFLVGLVTHPDDRRFLLEDLAEEHRRRVATEGRGRAAAWYWRQAAGSLAPLAIERLRRISRPHSSSPAVGSAKRHQAEQEQLVREVFEA